MVVSALAKLFFLKGCGIATSNVASCLVNGDGVFRQILAVAALAGGSTGGAGSKALAVEFEASTN